MSDLTSPASRSSHRKDPLAVRPRHDSRDGADFWPTPACLTAALVQFVLPSLPPGPVWECAAGEGHLARAIAASGRRVVATDLFSWPTIRRVDFLHDEPPAEAHGLPAITNPPFSHWDDFLARGLSLLDSRVITGLVLLIRHDYLQAGSRVEVFNRASLEVRCCWRPQWLPGTTGQGRWSCSWILWSSGPRRPPLYLQKAALEQPPLPLFAGAAQPPLQRTLSLFPHQARGDPR
jgi:hypothetical protein